MKKLIEDNNEGLLALIGETVIIYCCRYIYHGKLVGVNDTCIKLASPSIIFETGGFDAPKYADQQDLCVQEWYIQTASIESFGVGK